MKLIETSHLSSWAASKASESRFPHLVKDLIRATIDADKLRMPSGDAVWVPGFDGEISNSQENRFVPTGFSVWEIGTNSSPASKAKEDYDKRTIDIAPSEEDKKTRKRKIPKRKIDRSALTFVFVTPRVWDNKEDWVYEKRTEGVWKDIQVIDGTDNWGPQGQIEGIQSTGGSSTGWP